MLKLFKGDDTGGTFGRRLQFVLTIPEGISTDGCRAEFELDGLVKTFDGPLVSGQNREIYYSNRETSAMQIGTRMGTFRLVDAQGRVRTIDNTIPVKVTDIVGEIYPGASSATVVIGGAITWDQIEGKPAVVKSVNGVTPDAAGNVNVTAEMPACTIEDLPPEWTEHQMAMKIKEILTWMRSGGAALAIAVSTIFNAALNANADIVLDVQTAVKSNILSSASIVTNVTISGTGGIDTNAVRDIVREEVPDYAATASQASAACAATNDFLRSSGGRLTHDLDIRGTEEELNYPSLNFKYGGGQTYASIQGDGAGNLNIAPIDGSVRIGKAVFYGDVDFGSHRLADYGIVDLRATDRGNIRIGDTELDVLVRGDVDPVDVGAYPASDGDALAQQVAAIGAHLNAEDAHFVSTNYDSVTRIPEAYVEIKMDGSWLTIWKEMTRWDRWTGPDFDWSGWNGFGSWKATVESELSFKAERSWGLYDSETGGYSPDGYTQISSSNILIAAGMAYQRTVTTDGAVWILQCNSGTASFGGDTNGFFRIKDADGNTQIEIVKGDKREMGADATGIEVDNSGGTPVLSIPYSVEAGEHPTIQVCTDLSTADWHAEDDAACPALVSWSGSSGAWVARVARKTPGNQLFVRATYMAGGETYIRNVAPVGMDSIMLNGVKYYLGTATIDGHTVLTLSTTRPAN